MKIHKIVARDLPDLWFQAVHDILDHGRRFKIDRGSYAGQTRLEYDFFTGHILQPWHGAGTKEILPDIPASVGIPNPVELGYVYGGEGYERSYIEYVMTAEKQPGESYTYGERLVQAEFNNLFAWNDKERKEIVLQDEDLWHQEILYFENDIVMINQIELIIWTYKKYGHRNNQMVLQVAQPSDCFLQDPPCLRSIDTRIQDNKLHFIIYFRSWDLWGGLPANLAGIQALQQYMADAIGVEHGQMIVESKGLHLYGYAEKLAELRCLKG